ncbi:MAG: S-adenosylmethionine decarboxylase [Pseudomonadota bacterium]
MQGLHLTADLHNCRCDPAWMLDAEKLGAWCREAVATMGLQQHKQLFDSFSDSETGNGITMTLLLAGSHVCIHAWPAKKAAAVDVFLCGSQASLAPNIMQTLVDRFAPEWTEQRSLDRGDES